MILHRYGSSSFEITNANHTCPIALVEKRKLEPVFLKTNEIMDLTAEIRIKVELLALSDITPAQLAIIRISNDFELLLWPSHSIFISGSNT